MNAQREMPLIGAMPSVKFAPQEVVRGFASYREAVIWCWQNRPCHGLREADDQSLCARVLGMHPPHLSRCVNPESKAPMSLPPDYLTDFESYTGWKAASQYVAAKADMTILEQVIADRKVAA